MLGRLIRNKFLPIEHEMTLWTTKKLPKSLTKLEGGTHTVSLKYKGFKPLNSLCLFR